MCVWFGHVQWCNGIGKLNTSNERTLTNRSSSTKCQSDSIFVGAQFQYVCISATLLQVLGKFYQIRIILLIIMPKSSKLMLRNGDAHRGFMRAFGVILLLTTSWICWLILGLITPVLIVWSPPFDYKNLVKLMDFLYYSKSRTLTHPDAELKISRWCRKMPQLPYAITSIHSYCQ